MNTSLKGKRAVVTGSSRGIGRGTAEELAMAGADVVINFRSSKTEADDTVASIKKMGVACHAIQADVSNPAEVAGFVDRCVDALGGIDIFVNNVGGFFFSALMDTELDEFERVLASNLGSVFACCKAVVPHMIRSGGGAIVNIGVSPVDRVRGAANVGAYAIAKTGVGVFSRTLAHEVAAHGIRVNVVSPGLVDSGSLPPEQAKWMIERVPLGRLGTVSEVAAAVAFLVSPAASYISGADLAVSGAWDWFNRPVDHDAMVKELFDKDTDNG